MQNTTAWDRGLRVGADGKGMVGHSGAVLLRRLADRSGLITALTRVFPVGGSGWRDRAVVFVHLAISIALGARSVLESEKLALNQHRLFGPAASDSTIRRLLAGIDDNAFAALARARATARRIVWTWLALRPGGFPWLTVAGKHLQRWVIVDIDATIITAASRKEGASATFKRTYGFHPLAAWCANTQECLAMMLRTGSAGSNTATDHITTLDEALAQNPHSSSAKILVRLDGAGATHDLHKHMEKLNTARRRVRFTTGWKITDADEAAIAQLPEHAWESSLKQDGTLHDTDHSAVAELTGLNRRKGWSKGMRLIVRRAGTPRTSPTSRRNPAGSTRSSRPTSPNSGESPARTRSSGSTPCTGTTPSSRTASARTRPWAYTISPPSPGPPTAAGCSRRTSPPTSAPDPASSSSTTRRTWPTPNPRPCGCGSTIKPAVSPDTLASGASASTRHGPGPPRSPSPGTGSPACPRPLDQHKPAPPSIRKENTRSPRARGTRRSRSDTRRPHPPTSGTNGAKPPPRQAGVTADESRSAERRRSALAQADREVQRAPRGGPGGAYRTADRPRSPSQSGQPADLGEPSATAAADGSRLCRPYSAYPASAARRLSRQGAMPSSLRVGTGRLRAPARHSGRAGLDGRPAVGHAASAAARAQRPNSTASPLN